MVLNDIGYDAERHFLCGDKYQTTSLLSFYGTDQRRAYFVNINNARDNQFTFWPGIDDEQQGKDGFFVAIAKDFKSTNGYVDRLHDYFGEVDVIGQYPLTSSYGRVTKKCLVIRVGTVRALTSHTS